MRPRARRWPADPAQLVDTTRCPACFSTLTSTRCDVCGLDLGGSRGRRAPGDVDRDVRGRARPAASSSRGCARAQAAREAAVGRGGGPGGPHGGRDGGGESRPTAIPMAPIRRSPDAVPTSTSASIPVAAPVAVDAPRRASLVRTDAVGDDAAALRRAGAPAHARRGAHLGHRRSCSSSSPTSSRASRCARSSSPPRACSCSDSRGCCGHGGCPAPPRAWHPSPSCSCCSTSGSCARTRCSARERWTPPRTRASRSRSWRGLLAAVRAVSGIRVPGFAAAALAPVSGLPARRTRSIPQTATGVWIGGLAAVLVAAAAAALARTVARARDPARRGTRRRGGLARRRPVRASRPVVERGVDPPRGGGRLHAHRRRSSSLTSGCRSRHGAGRPPPRPERRSRSRPPSGSSPNWTSRSRRGSRRRSRGR